MALILPPMVLWFLVRKQAAQPAKRQERRPTILIVGDQIICGDCAGKDGLETYLDRFGNCARCGEENYRLAGKEPQASSCRNERGLRSYKRALDDICT